MFKTLVVVLCALLKVHAANFDVNVGQTGLTFTPDHVSGAASGDTVTFHFYPSSHSVTQSSLETPCEDLTGGFDSEIRQGSADGSETFVVNVTSTDPIWICCYTPGHCAAGMVFAINPTSDSELAQFQQNARGGGNSLSSSPSGSPTSGGSSSTGTGQSTGSSPSTTHASTTASTGQGFASVEVTKELVVGLAFVGSIMLSL